MTTKPTARLQVVGEKAPYDENLRLWLVNFLKDTGMTTTEFARQAGNSRAMYDDYVNCKYFGVLDPKSGKVRTTENSKCEPSIRAFRARLEGPNTKQRSDFVKTTASHQVAAAITTAVEENSITAVISPWGWGKSRCTREFVFKRLKQPVVFTLCSPSITTRYFLQKIARELRLDAQPTSERQRTKKARARRPSLSHTIPELEDQIVDHLKSHPRVLVVDQANYLPPKALGSITYIWEASGVPVTLVGTPTLKLNFLSLEMTDDERGQLASRVSAWYGLTGLDLGTVKSICHRVLGKAVATNELVKELWEASGGLFTDTKGDLMQANFRALESLLRRLQQQMRVYPDMPVEQVMEKVEALQLAA